MIISKMYYKWIKRGVITIDDVAEPWKSEVQAMLDADAAAAVETTTDTPLGE